MRRVPDLLVGTPGRLLDYEQQGATTFRDVEILVIDEADRMFDMGFIRDLRQILRRCPPYNKRQTLLFSATLSLRVMELAYEHTNNAEKIEIEPERVCAHGITRGPVPRLLGARSSASCSACSSRRAAAAS